MSSGKSDQEAQILSDELEREKLETEESRLIQSPHHGFADASRGNRLAEEIQELDTKLFHERERQSEKSR